MAIDLSSRLSPALAQGVAVPNLSGVVVRPRTAQAIGEGAALASGLLDNLTVRPRQRAAEVAAADAGVASAGAVSQQAKLAGEAARQGFEQLKDPAYRAKEADAQVTAIEGDLFRAQDARAKLDQNDPEYRTRLDQMNKRVAKLTGDLQLAKDNAKIEQAVFSTGASAARAGETRATTAERSAQQEQLRQPLVDQTAMVAASTGLTGAETIQDRAAIERAKAASELRGVPQTVQAADAIRQAGELGALAAAEVRSRPEYLESVKQVEAATALMAAKKALFDLNSVGATALDDTTLDALKKAGLTPINPTTGKRWTPVEATNLVNGAERVKALQEGTQSAITTAQSAENVLRLLQNTDTGVLYGLPGVQQVDRLLAQFGFDEAQRREQIGAEAMGFIAQIRKNFPGQVSNFEMQLYSRAAPGVGASPETNRALAMAALATAERAQQMPAFVSSLLGPMSYEQAEAEWNQYIEKNPIVVSGIGGATTPNSFRLSPDEWLAARNDPAGFQSAKAKQLSSTPGARNALPVGVQNGDRVVGPVDVPFVVYKNGVTPNDNYWDGLN